MTTRRRSGADAASARTERTRKLGMAVVPAMARAPLRRKNLRLVCMRYLVRNSSQFLVHSSQLVGAFEISHRYENSITAAGILESLRGGRPGVGLASRLRRWLALD